MGKKESETIFTCRYCCKSFGVERYRNKHEARQKLRKELNKVRCDEKLQKKKYHCDQCKKAFNRKENMERHTYQGVCFKRKKTPTKKCIFCTRSFAKIKDHENLCRKKTETNRKVQSVYKLLINMIEDKASVMLERLKLRAEPSVVWKKNVIGEDKEAETWFLKNRCIKVKGESALLALPCELMSTLLHECAHVIQFPRPQMGKEHGMVWKENVQKFCGWGIPKHLVREAKNEYATSPPGTGCIKKNIKGNKKNKPYKQNKREEENCEICIKYYLFRNKQNSSSVLV